MSSVPDTEELKAKYAEIAAIKKAIEDKKANKISSQPGIRRHDNISKPHFLNRRHLNDSKSIPWAYGLNNMNYRNNNFKNGNLYRSMSVRFPNSTVEQTEQGQSPQYVSSISKSGMSLVNSETYEKEKGKILRHYEEVESRKEREKQKKQEVIWRARLEGNRIRTENCDRVKIKGNTYAVTKGGNELILIENGGEQLINVAMWNKSNYVGYGDGNLKCRNDRVGRPLIEHCKYFCSTGMCQKGSNCLYKHDRDCIRLCRQYLANNCTNRNCLLSHTPTQYNTPHCRYFIEHNCTHSHCIYEHSLPRHCGDSAYEIWICRPFAIGGVCLRGKKCPFLHLYVCPDFQETGSCPRGMSCSLNHSATPSVQRLISSSEKDAQDTNDVLVESDSESSSRGKKIISSYTVDPSFLFVVSKRGNYEVYIDTKGKDSKSQDPQQMDPGSEQRIMIQLDSDSGDGSGVEDASADEQAEESLDSFVNNDYIGLDSASDTKRTDSTTAHE